MPLAAYFVMTYEKLRRGTHDPSILMSNLIFQEALMSYSLILATTPCLRTFVSRFSTGGIREIVALDKRTDSEFRGTSTKAFAVQTYKSMATQIRMLGAYEIFDTHVKRSEGRKHLAFRPDIENQNWAEIISGRSMKQDKDRVELGMDQIETRATWEVHFEHAEGWEMRRAQELMDAPRRPSLASINFITTAQW